MYNEWQGLNATQHSPTLGRDWLLMMGEGEPPRRSLASGLQSSKSGSAVVTGAAKANVTVQYCMTMARMVLQSAEIPGTQNAQSLLFGCSMETEFPGAVLSSSMIDFRSFFVHHNS